ncbi:MAG: hypothetical protein AB7S38_08015 [Vulcanimicrobiota bacterium]
MKTHATPGWPQRAYHVKSGNSTQTLVGLASPQRIESGNYVARDYYEDAVVGFDPKGEILYKTPVGGTFWEMSYQKEADQVCLKTGEAIEVIKASSGERVARIAPKGLEFLSALVALSDGRFAINTRNEDNNGVVTTFDPQHPDQTSSATLTFLPLEMKASATGTVIAERTDYLAVVKAEKVLFESDRISSHQYAEEGDKIWCLEALPNKYHGTQTALVGVNTRTGEVESYPYEGRSHQIFSNEKGQFLVQESHQRDTLTLRWLAPGQPAGELFTLEGRDLQQVHVDGSDSMLVVTRDDQTHRVYELAPDQPPRQLFQTEGGPFMTVARTDKGLLAFTMDKVFDVEHQREFGSLVEMVDNLGVPEVHSRQLPGLASMSRERGPQIDEVFHEIINWKEQPNPLVTAVGSKPVAVGGGINLALAGSDLPKVVEELITSGAAVRQALAARPGLISEKSLRFQGLEGWEVLPNPREIVIAAPAGQTANRAIHVPEGAFLTSLETVNLEGEPYVAAGFSSGDLVWAQARENGRTYRFDLGAAISSVSPHNDGLLATCTDGSLHYVDTGARVKWTDQTTHIPQLLQDEDTLIIGDIAIDIQH